MDLECSHFAMGVMGPGHQGSAYMPNSGVWRVAYIICQNGFGVWRVAYTGICQKKWRMACGVYLWRMAYTAYIFGIYYMPMKAYYFSLGQMVNYSKLLIYKLQHSFL